MCTALSFNQFFGRNLDYEFSYGEQVAITPRNYDFHFRHLDKHESHYAIVGMAHVFEEYPLYYDAMNEKGLGMAGLNFVGNAKFYEVKKKRTMWLPLNLFLGSYRNVQVSKRQESYQKIQMFVRHHLMNNFQQLNYTI